MTIWFVLFHILAALWFTAGVFASVVTRVSIKRATELRDRVVALRLTWRLYVMYTRPGVFAVGLLGLYLVPARGHSFTAPWVVASLALFAAMLVGTLLAAPRLRRTLEAGERALAAGEPSPEFEALVGARQLSILADANAMGIVILTLLMVLGP